MRPLFSTWSAARPLWAGYVETVTTARQESFAARLARLGFADPARAESLLTDPALTPMVGPVPAGEGLDQQQQDAALDKGHGWLSALVDTADPDLALFALLRLFEAIDSDTDRGELRDALAEDGTVRRRLFAVLGASAALGDHLARHPEHWGVLAEQDTPNPDHDPDTVVGDPLQISPDVLRDELLQSVGADPAAAVPVATVSVAG